MKPLDISAFLYRKKLKQRELAESLGVSLGFVGQLATGKSKVSYDVLLKLIDLGITLEELFGAEYSEKLLKNSHDSQIMSKDLEFKLTQVMNEWKETKDKVDILGDMCSKIYKELDLTGLELSVSSNTKENKVLLGNAAKKFLRKK